MSIEIQSFGPAPGAGAVTKNLRKNVLVDASNADDACVYRITDDVAVVLTADFFTPISDDPYWFGANAASNSLSEVYAMGAKPVAALNIAMFPNQEDFFPSLKKIMQGVLKGEVS